MDYFKAFEKLKTALEKAKVPVTDGHFAVQVRITDEDCGGIFYIEKKDMQLYVEPYDYYDNNVDVAASFDTFKAIFDGKTDAEESFANGTLIINGDAEGFFAITKPIFEKKAKKSKTAAKPKKPTPKSAEKKTKTACRTAKKTTSAKTTKDTKAVKKETPKKETPKKSKLADSKAAEK